MLEGAIRPLQRVTRNRGSDIKVGIVRLVEEDAMCYYVGIESLAVGALVELLQSESGERTVSFRKLEEYGNQVVDVLKWNGEDAILILSREDTLGFIRDCTKFFEVNNGESSEGSITLREGFTAKDLAKEFCGGISTPVIRALIDRRAVRVLLAA